MSPVVPAGGDRDLRGELLPAEILPLFDDGFVAASDRIEEHVFRLALSVARESGLWKAAGGGGSAAEIASRAGFDEAAGPPLARWLLALLAERGIVPPSPLPDLDAEEIERSQQEDDPASLPTFRLAALAAEAYPRVLRGETSGEAALFSADRIEAWASYFSNRNPLYAVGNAIGAEALVDRLPHPAGSVLEIGGGFGSGAEAVFRRFAREGALSRVAAYRFTEVAPLFLRKGQRALSTLPETAGKVAFGRLDMDRPFAEAGVAPGSLSAVFGVNTLHVARDLGFTLGEIRAALAPGGILVASECVRPFQGRTVWVEFVFLLLPAFRAGGFRTPEEWTTAFEEAGFVEPFVWPDVPRIREHYPAFVAAAVGAIRP